MADRIDIFVELRNAVQASRNARLVSSSVKGIGDAAVAAGRRAGQGAALVERAGDRMGRSFLQVASSAKYPAAALGGLAAAGVKWGLAFNAQVESARLRFKLFTDDVDGLTKSVQGIDMASAFNFADLADGAAMLGNSGIKDIPNVLQAAANAAAASGKGLPALQSIVVALSQIQAKGKLSQEEINQLNDAGAPGAQKIIQRAFHLTSAEIGNLGGQGLSSKKAIKALTDEWTSGRMANAAKAQTKTLGGQWDLLTGNVQKASGALTEGLAGGLEKRVLPAANKTASAITAIFNDDTLAPEEKLRRARQVIDKNLGPIADDLLHSLDEADIPEHLGDLIGKAVPLMANAATDAAPHVAKAFIDGWRHAGLPAQIASSLFIGAKLTGKAASAYNLLTSGGRGGLAGALGSVKPVPVFVTNAGFGNAPGRGTPGGGVPAGTPGRSRVKIPTEDLRTARPLGEPSTRGAGGALAASLLLPQVVSALPISQSAKTAINGGGETTGFDQLPPATQQALLEHAGVIPGGGLLGDAKRVVGTGSDLVSNLARLLNNQPIVVRSETTTKLNGRVVAKDVELQQAQRRARAAGYGP